MSGADEGRQAVGDAWGDEISDARKAELEQRLQAWEQEADHGKRRGPFDRRGLSGADVFWLSARAAAGVDKAGAVEQQVSRMRLIPAAVVFSASLPLDNLHLEGANLHGAHLEGANLYGAHLEGAYLATARLEGAFLNTARLETASLSSVHLEGTYLYGAHLEGADLFQAHLEGAGLWQAHLEGANLCEAHLEGRGSAPDAARYQRVQQQVSNFPQALVPTDLRGAFLDSTTVLLDIILGTPGQRQGQGYVQVADVHWGGVNLAVVKDWPGEMVLGDEREAWAWQPPTRKVEDRGKEVGKNGSRPKRTEARRQQEQAWQSTVAEAAQKRLELFRAAVRANRQLATALREQGMNEEADRFFYRAQVCQRQVFRLRHQRARQAFSWLLDVVSGHGYQPGKTLAWYLAVIFTFAAAYLAASHGILTFGLPPSSFGKLAWYEALVLSVSSFHGRGFLPFPNLGDPITILAAIEAVFGLFIEVSFIATFTQRFFGK